MVNDDVVTAGYVGSYDGFAGTGGLEQCAGRAFAIGGEDNAIGILNEGSDVAGCAEVFDYAVFDPITYCLDGNAPGVLGVHGAKDLEARLKSNLSQQFDGLDKIQDAFVRNEARYQEKRKDTVPPEGHNFEFLEVDSGAGNEVDGFGFDHPPRHEIGRAHV